MRVPAGAPRAVWRPRTTLAVCLVAAVVLPSPGTAAPTETPLTIRVDPAAQSSETVVATLEQAVERVRRQRARGTASGAVVIALAGGVHRLERPVRIDAEVAPGEGRTLTLRGAADGSTVVRGSLPLARVESPLPAGAPEAARARAVAYRLPPSAAAQPSIAVRRIHPVPAEPVGLELFDDAGALEPARWPNAGWAAARLPASAGPDATILVEGGRADRWLAETDLWVTGYLGATWSFETAAAVSAIRGSGRLVLAQPPHYPLRDGDRYAVMHALAELDAPGEWWRGGATVHLIPRGPGPVEASVATGLVELVGARDVTLSGLTLERVRGDAVVVRGGAGVVVEDCTIRWAAGRGLVVEGAVRSGLRRSVVADTGDGGVTLHGGERALLTPGGNFLEDSVLVRFARLGRTYKAAADLDGVGQRVVGNLMAQAPHQAIRYHGNDHEIALNEIAGVATETSDSGAIYTGRDIAAQGTTIRANYLHDVAPAALPDFEVKGVYLDDMASGQRIADNVFLRVQQPVFVGGGRDNTVTGNVFVASAPALWVDGRGKSWPGPAPDHPDSTIAAALREVPTTSPRWAARYPLLARLMRDDPAAAKRNLFRDNLLVASGAPRVEQGADARQQTIEGNGTLAEPCADGCRDLGTVAGLVAGRPEAARIPFAEMDRLAVLRRQPALRRRIEAVLPDGAATPLGAARAEAGR